MKAIDLFSGASTGAIPVDDRTANRFAEKVNLSGECWEWSAGLVGGGYGQFHFNKKPSYAHRWLYQRVIAEVPDDMTLDHLCRNRKCVRPSHLEIVTRGENVLRGIGFAAINSAITHCPSGHPYAGDNLVVKTDGSRRCRECHRVGARKAHARRSNESN